MCILKLKSQSVEFMELVSKRRTGVALVCKNTAVEMERFYFKD